MSLWCRRDGQRCTTHNLDWGMCVSLAPLGTWSDDEATLLVEASEDMYRPFSPPASDDASGQTP